MKLTAPQWFGIFIIFIMISSTGGFILTYSDSTTTSSDSYNGFAFTTTTQGIYQTRVQGSDYLFNNHPATLNIEDIPEPFLKALETKTITLSYNSRANENVTPLLAEQQYFLERVYTNQRYAVTHAIENTGLPNPPSKNCNDAKPSSPVLYLTTGDTDTTIFKEPACLSITVATPEALIKTAELLAYYALGILP